MKIDGIEDCRALDSIALATKASSVARSLKLRHVDLG